jgi:protease IV
MLLPRFAPAWRWICRCWSLLDSGRRFVFNLFFLLVVLALMFALMRSSKSGLDDKTTLLLNLQGGLVEQRASHPRDAALAQIGSGKSVVNTQLRDVLAALEAAQLDSKISSALLLLDEFEGAGLPALREVASALERFKASGKTVVAWGMGFDQRQYFLAAHANEVYLHPMGVVLLQGYGGYRNYYREALDKLGVRVSLVRAGAFKNAGEIYTADEPSPASVEASSFLYNAMWNSYTQDVEKVRKLANGSIMGLINDLPEQLTKAGHDPAQLAHDHRWVDGLKTRDEIRLHMIDRGLAGINGNSFRQISLENYVRRQPLEPRGDRIGVVVAEGAIVDGVASAGTIGGVSTAELIRQARLNSRIKAVVLRVNSPGGSPLGSELIRRELELTRSSGKPVVVSMGDVAASGGYWISMAADEVWADAATVTGSIGVFALLPHADQALDKLGVHTGGLTTTWLGAVADPRRPPDPRFNALLQNVIDQTYTNFTTKAAAARNTTVDAIHAVAQGRVWTGAQAQERGLIDHVGGLHAALQAAAKRAQLGTGAQPIYIEAERSKLDRLLGLVGGATAEALVEHLPSAARTMSPLPLTPRLAQEASQELSWLIRIADAGNPFATLAHCLCGKY